MTGPRPYDRTDAERLLQKLLRERGLSENALTLSRADVLDALVEAVEAGQRRELAELGGVRFCRVCGCTDTHACEGGCWWVADDLCSSCAPELTARPLDAIGGSGIR